MKIIDAHKMHNNEQGRLLVRSTFDTVYNYII